jgi:hypothetical protein
MRPCLEKNSLPIPYVKRGEGSRVRRDLFRAARNGDGAVDVQLKKVA